MCRTSGALEKRRWDRLLIGWRSLWGFVFQRVRLLRDAGLSPQKTRGVPTNRGKAGRTLRRCSSHAAERPLRRVNQGAQGGIDRLLVREIRSARRYTQTLLTAR